MKKTFFITALSLALSSSAFASAFPNLPAGFKDGGGALISDTAYVGLGSLGDAFYALSLKDGKAWEKLPAFPGGERSQPVVAAVDGKLYVFGGLQKNAKGELQLVNDAYVFDPTASQWETLPTRAPLGLVGASAFVSDGKIYIVGGSNTPIFNGYFQDYTAADDDGKKAVMEKYFNQRAEDYFFNNILYSYSPADGRWRNEGQLPFSGRAGAAVAIDGTKAIIANGEIKPGLRTDEVSSGEVKDGKWTWTALPVLIGAKAGEQQEGLAGAYSGFSNGQYLLTGGANFPGAHAQYEKGELFAHKGLKKAHHADIYALSGDKWSVVGKLPTASGYGVTLPYNGKLLLIGGATDEKEPLASVTTLEWKDGKVVIE